MQNLGKMAKDKITGLEGYIVSKVTYLLGYEQYGIAPKAEGGKINDTAYFDVGRVEIMGEGIAASSVQSDEPGGVARDAPSK